jgi:6-phospho-beta-glucosidase
MMESLRKIDVDKEPEKAFNIFISHYLERENSYMAIESQHARVKEQTAPSMDEFINTPDHGGYAGVALNFIKSYHTGNKIQMVLSVPNDGAIDGLLDEDVIEVTCNIDKNGATPVKISSIPELQMNLIRTVKFYERMAAEAIREKSIKKAVMALTAHPMVNSYSLAKQLVEKYIEANKKYTGVWE